MTILHYNSLLKKIIKSIKYRLAKEVAQELFAVFNGKMLGKLSFYKRIGAPLWAVCIPLHKAKLKQRGFNQAELVEEFVRTYIPLEPLTALERRHERHAQAMLARGLAKHQNVRGVFAVVSPEKVRGKTIVLIDDIVTTGATVREAARVLKLAGAAKVFIIALAKG